MRRWSILTIVMFLGLFVYFYKTSGKFKKSICAALVAVFVLVSVPLESESKGVDGFNIQPQPTHNQRNRNGFSKRSGNDGPGKPNGSDGDGSDDNNDIPKYPKVESVKETEQRIENIDKYLEELETSSDSEEEQCEVEKTEVEKTNIDVKIVNDQIIVRVTRGNKSVLINESSARKKIYHAADFDVSLPANLDLDYVKSLKTKERLEYLSPQDILPQKCVGEYMKKLSQHFVDPNTEIKIGTLGKNGETKGWNERTQGIHAFNNITKNDIFFADREDQDPTFHTCMTLNDMQIEDLNNNNNIL